MLPFMFLSLTIGTKEKTENINSYIINYNK